MKKFSFILSIVAIVLMSGFGFIYYTEGAEAFSTNTVEIQEEYELKGNNVKNLSIQSNSTDVAIVPHQQESILVEFHGEVSEKMEDAFDLTVLENNDTLHIELVRKMQPSFTFFAINKGTLLTVKVPAKYYENVLVESTSGDIKLDTITTTNMTVQATSGDISVEKISAEAISITATSGDIDGNHVMAESNMELETTSGDIFLATKNYSSYTLDFQSNSGDWEINDSGVYFNKNEENRMTGKKGDGKLSIVIRTTSGDFSME